MSYLQQIPNQIQIYLDYANDEILLESFDTKNLLEIMRDIGRTFPTHPFFIPSIGPGEGILARILRASFRFRQDVGYCQGMNFVVAALILARFHDLSALAASSELDEDTWPPSSPEASEEYVPNYEAEADVFWLFQSLLSPFQSDGTIAPTVERISQSPGWSISDGKILCLASIWSHGFPKMKLRVYQFDRLLQWNLPQLASHLQQLGLSTEVVVSQWFMTIFAYAFPLQDLFHVWDYIFTLSWKGVHKLTLAILFVMRENIADMDLEKVGLLLRDWKKGDFVFPVSTSELLHRAEMFVVTDEMLTSLHESYGLDILTTARESKRIQAAIAAGVEDEVPKDRESDSGGGLRELERQSALSDSIRKSFREKDKESYRDMDRERLTDRGSMGIPRPGGPAWLQCLGDISVDMVSEMEATNKELAELEVELEKKKEALQKQIFNACDASERSSSSLDTIQIEERAWSEKVIRLDRLVSKWQNRTLALSQGCPALVQRVETDDGDADWEDDCRLANEFEELVRDGFEDEEESETTLSIADSDRSPPKSISRSQSWPEYSPSAGTDLDQEASTAPSSPLSPTDTHTSFGREGLVLLELISTLPPRSEKRQGASSSFDRSTASDQRDQMSHGWMTHPVTKHFRTLTSNSHEVLDSPRLSDESFVDIFGTHNIISPSLRSQMQKSDSVVVSRTLLSKRHPPKYIHRFRKVGPRLPSEEKEAMPSEEGGAGACSETDSTGTDSDPQTVAPRATLRRPLLPLRRSISLSLRTGFGMFLGAATKEMISSVPSGLETLSSSLMRSPTPSPETRKLSSSSPPSPAASLSSLSPAQRALVIRSQRIKRIRDRKPSPRELSPRVLLRRREVSRRILSPEEYRSAEDLLLESQSQTLREMQNRVAKLTRALEVAKWKYSSIQSHFVKAQVADEEMKKWKEIVCDEYQGVLHEFAAKRSQKLIYIAEKYGT